MNGLSLLGLRRLEETWQAGHCTLSDIRRDFVLPSTQGRQSSFVEYLSEKEESSVGIADYVVIYSRTARFRDVLAALEV